jgi:flagellar biosynthesis protein FliQ
VLFSQEIFEYVFQPMVQKTVHLILTNAAPMLLAAIATGIGVSIFQATTKIQEQTLSFVPKIVATFAALVIYVPKVKREGTDFLLEILGYISQMQVDAVLK